MGWTPKTGKLVQKAGWRPKTGKLVSSASNAPSDDYVTARPDEPVDVGGLIEGGIKRDASLPPAPPGEYDVSPNDEPYMALAKDMGRVGKSALGGMTMGGAPYVEAAIDSAFSDRNFDNELAANKRAYNQAEKQEPLAALGGSLMTPVPGTGLKGAAKVAGMAGTGAGYAGVNSYLHNEDLDRGGAALDAVIPATIGGVLGGTVGVVANHFGKKADGALVPFKKEIDAANNTARAKYKAVVERADDATFKNINQGNKAEVASAQKAILDADDAASRYPGETALYMDRSTALRQKAEDAATERLLKQNTQEMAAARKEQKSADAYARRYATDVEKSKQAKELASRKAQARATKEVRSENLDAVKPFEKADASLRNKAIQDLIRRTRENGGSEAKLKARVEDALAKKESVEASKGAHIARETQRDYDAVRNFESSLRAKADANPEAIAQLEKLQAASGDVGEKHMLNIAANPPAARADAKTAAEAALAERRLQALLAEKPKAPGAMEAAQELDAPVLPEEAINLVHEKYRTAAEKMGQMPPEATRLTSAQVRELAARRNTPEWLAERDPGLAQRLKAPEPLPAGAPFPTRPVPAEMSPDMARFLAQKEAANVKLPPAPDAPVRPDVKVPDRLSADQIRELVEKRKADPAFMDFLERDLNNPSLARDLRAGDGVRAMPLNEELAKLLPEKGGGIVSSAIGLARAPARALLGLATDAPQMTQGGYKRARGLETLLNVGGQGQKIVPNASHAADMVRDPAAKKYDEAKGAAGKATDDTRDRFLKWLLAGGGK